MEKRIVLFTLPGGSARMHRRTAKLRIKSRKLRNRILAAAYFASDFIFISTSPIDKMKAAERAALSSYYSIIAFILRRDLRNMRGIIQAYGNL